MSVRRESNTHGDTEARKIKVYIVESIKRKTGHDFSHQTIDQLIRTAAKAGLSFGIYEFTCA